MDLLPRLLDHQEYRLLLWNSHTNLAAQHRIAAFYLSGVYIHGYTLFLCSWLQEWWFEPSSEHSEVCSTALCTGIAGPQLSMAINSQSPMGSRAESKILLFRWVSETVVVITLDLFAFSCRTQVLASSVWALCLSLQEPTPLAARRRLCQPRAPLCSSSFQVVDKHSGFPSTVTGVLFNYHLGTAPCPSSSATPQGLGQLLGPQANWTLGKKLQ